MRKRGQIYFLASLLLALVIFGLVIRLNVLRKESIDDDFEELSADYDRESSRFINTLLQEGNVDATNFGDSYSEFTVDFTRYSKTQNPDFGLLYLFDFQTEDAHNLYVGNYLEEDILVGIGPIPIGGDLLTLSTSLDGCKSVVDAGYEFLGFESDDVGIQLEDVALCAATLTPFNDVSYNAYFLLEGIVYTTDITVGVPEVVLVSSESLEGQRKIFVNDEFIEGELNEDLDQDCIDASNDPDQILRLAGSGEIATSIHIQSQCEYIRKNTLGRFVYTRSFDHIPTREEWNNHVARSVPTLTYGYDLPDATYNQKINLRFRTWPEYEGDLIYSPSTAELA